MPALLTALTLALAAPAVAAEPPRPAADAWLLVDAADREVLASRNPDARRPVASTTKLMTAFLALRELALGERVVAPPYRPLPGESLMGLEAGQRVSVRSLLYGLLLASGNDAAVALADAVSGSLPEFVARMNATARRLGLDDTRYANPIGLDDPANYSSARDLVALTLRLRRERVFRRIVDTAEARVPGARPERVENHNHLLATEPFVNGVKTGYTGGAGFVLVGSGTRRDVTLVSVVLGAPSTASRDAATLALLDYGFGLYRQRVAVVEGDTLARARVEGADGRVPLAAARSVRVSARRDQRVSVRVDAPRELTGPLARGAQAGTATVAVAGASRRQVALVVARPVAAPESGGGGLSGAAVAALAGGAIVILIGGAWAARRGGGRRAPGKSQ